MRYSQSVLLGILLSIVIAACGSSDQTTSSPDESFDLTGRWRLDSVSVEGEQVALTSERTRSDPSTSFWISFDAGGSMLGEGACNDFEGKYALVEGKLTATEVRSSLVLCEPDEILERDLLEMIAADATTAEFDGPDFMTLLSPSLEAGFVRAQG